jgi:hypothetical protein
MAPAATAPAHAECLPTLLHSLLPPCPFNCRAETLETLGRVHYRDSIHGLVKSAHPHRLPNGDIIGMAADFYPVLDSATAQLVGGDERPSSLCLPAGWDCENKFACFAPLARCPVTRKESITHRQLLPPSCRSYSSPLPLPLPLPAPACACCSLPAAY